MRSRYVISADIGSFHIKAAVVDLHRKMILPGLQRHVDVDSTAGAAVILDTWVSVLKEVLYNNPYQIRCLAVSAPGPFDYNNGICFIKNLQKYDALFGMNVKRYLSAKLGLYERDINFLNDAEAFLYGELFAGAALGAKRVVCFTLGNGMGSAKALNGHIKDANWGSLSFGDTIADDYFSNRWLLNEYFRTSGLLLTDIPALVDRAASDRMVGVVFKSFARNFAFFVGNLLMSKPPDLIIIGGGLTRFQELWFGDFKAHLHAVINADKILLPHLGGNARILGAASSFDEENGTYY